MSRTTRFAWSARLHLWSDHTRLCGQTTRAPEARVSAPKSRSHELVLQHIEAELVGGRLGVGARLPGERALAELVGVSRASGREAIKALEAMGIVRTGVGSR